MRENKKIYTTYISKIKDIPSSVQVAVIMRAAPASVQKMKDVVIISELSPTIDTLVNYKKDKDFDKFANSFNNQLANENETIEALTLLIDAVDNHNDVALVCCEKDHRECHRSLIGRHLKKLGYNVEEIGIENGY